MLKVVPLTCSTGRPLSRRKGAKRGTAHVWHSTALLLRLTCQDHHGCGLVVGLAERKLFEPRMNPGWPPGRNCKQVGKAKRDSARPSSSVGQRAGVSTNIKQTHVLYYLAIYMETLQDSTMPVVDQISTLCHMCPTHLSLGLDAIASSAPNGPATQSCSLSSMLHSEL